jgi:hypothetical protein
VGFCHIFPFNKFLCPCYSNIFLARINLLSLINFKSKYYYQSTQRFWGRTEAERPLARPRYRYKCNGKRDVQQIGWERLLDLSSSGLGHVADSCKSGDELKFHKMQTICWLTVAITASLKRLCSTDLAIILQEVPLYTFIQWHLTISLRMSGIKAFGNNKVVII